MTTKAQFTNEFGEFTADPGIQIRPGGGDKASLVDIYIFPDLDVLSPGSRTGMSAPEGRINSSLLTEFAADGGGSLILGGEDSGKTALLKVLARRYLEAGVYSLYIDGKSLRVPRSEETEEFFHTEYRLQYTPPSLELIERDPPEKRVLLLDNADRVVTGSRELGTFLSGLNSRFGTVLLTAAHSIEYSELPPGFSAFGAPEGYAVFSLRELGFALRDELISKWILAGGQAKDEETGHRRDMLKGAVDNVLERNLVPSYPVFVLTILQMADSDEQAGTGVSSYGHYHEYLILKQITRITDSENLSIFTAILSELAYIMFSRRSRWIPEEDVLALIDNETGESNNILGDPRSSIRNLIEADILSAKESGYEFKYGYIYHYFTALYLSLHIREESVKEEVRRLASGLDDEESANIILFLTYLSADPFLLEQIARNIEYAAAAEEPYASEDEENYLDELIVELEKLKDKDKRLKEIRAEYLSSVSTPERQPIGFRTNGTDIRVKRRIEPRGPGSLRRSRFIDSLLHISSEAFRTGTAKDRRDPPPGMDENMFILWSSSLRRRKREADRARESLQGMEGRAPGPGGTEEELSYTSSLRGLYMRIYMQSVRQLCLLTATGRNLHGYTIPDEHITLCKELMQKDLAPVHKAVSSFLEESPQRKFAREVLIECLSLRVYLLGEDQYSTNTAKIFG